jgi:hypothetical protein
MTSLRTRTYVVIALAALLAASLALATRPLAAGAAPSASAASQQSPPDPNGPHAPDAEPTGGSNDATPPNPSSHPAPAAKPKLRATPTIAMNGKRFLPGRLTVRPRARVIVLNMSRRTLTIRVAGRTLRLSAGAQRRIAMPSRSGRYLIVNARRPAMKMTVQVRR